MVEFITHPHSTPPTKMNQMFDVPPYKSVLSIIELDYDEFVWEFYATIELHFGFITFSWMGPLSSIYSQVWDCTWPLDSGGAKHSSILYYSLIFQHKVFHLSKPSLHPHHIILLIRMQDASILILCYPPSFNT